MPDRSKIAPSKPEYDVEDGLPLGKDCLYSRGEDTPGIPAEIEHHLRFQTGTVHGAGKRMDGFRREERLGELLDVERAPVEGLGSRTRETL